MGNPHRVRLHRRNWHCVRSVTKKKTLAETKTDRYRRLCPAHKQMALSIDVIDITYP